MFVFIALVSCESVQTVTQETGYDITPAFPGLSFSRPVDLQNANDGTDRLFVVEQAGRILVFQNSSVVSSSKTFLDIQDRVNDVGGEEGLLGLAFHPDYASNGFLYVNYTAQSPRRTVISRFSTDPANPDSADPATELIVLQFDQPFTNHNGGQLSFGPEGYLYIATGDGGSGGDPQNNAQNLNSLLGKILRIDVYSSSSGMNYGIPPDNPFTGTGFREEIYAYGLRNPWRFSFDPVTNALWTGDVGQDTKEEIDIIERGRNYGWRIMEGSLCFNPPAACDTSGLTLPVWEYGHDLGESVTGGFVYRGSDLPSLVGSYIYGDYSSGRIWMLQYGGVQFVTNTLLVDASINISSFGIDEDSELYVCGYDGVIYKFIVVV